MQVRHFFAALLLAFGIGQQVLAEEQKVQEAQQELQQSVQQGMQHAPAAQERAATGGIDEDKAEAKTEIPAASETSVAQPAAAETAAPMTAEMAEMAAAEASASASAAEDWLQSFLYEVKLTDVLLALFAGLLVLLGRDLARRMRDAASAAKESAAVAEKSARVAEDALIAGQRAFMFIREIKTYLHQDAETGRFHWTIHPIWANSGNTPTRNLSINTTYRLLDEPLPKDYDFPEAREDLIPTIAGPRSMVEALPGSISSEDLKAVKEGKKFFYIWGWAEYHDIFEGTKKRVTRFCNQLIEVEGDPATPINEHNPLQMMFGFHSENNYAD